MFHSFIEDMHKFLSAEPTPKRPRPNGDVSVPKQEDSPSPAKRARAQAKRTRKKMNTLQPGTMVRVHIRPLSEVLEEYEGDKPKIIQKVEKDYHKTIKKYQKILSKESYKKWKDAVDKDGNKKNAGKIRFPEEENVFFISSDTETSYSLYMDNGNGDGKEYHKCILLKKYVTLEKLSLSSIVEEEDRARFSGILPCMHQLGNGRAFLDDDANLLALTETDKKLQKHMQEAIKKYRRAQKAYEDHVKALEESASGGGESKDSIGTTLKETADKLYQEADDSGRIAHWDPAWDYNSADSSVKQLIEYRAGLAGMFLMPKGTKFQIIFEEDNGEKAYDVEVVKNIAGTTLTAPVIEYKYLDIPDEVDAEHWANGFLNFEEDTFVIPIQTGLTAQEMEEADEQNQSEESSSSSEDDSDGDSDEEDDFLDQEVWYRHTTRGGKSSWKLGIATEKRFKDGKIEYRIGTTGRTWVPEESEEGFNLYVYEADDRFKVGDTVYFKGRDRVIKEIKVSFSRGKTVTKAIFADDLKPQNANFDAIDKDITSNEDKQLDKRLKEEDKLETQAFEIGSILNFDNKQVEIVSKPYPDPNFKAVLKGDQAPELYDVKVVGSGETLTVPADELESPSEPTEYYIGYEIEQDGVRWVVTDIKDGIAEWKELEEEVIDSDNIDDSSSSSSSEEDDDEEELVGDELQKMLAELKEREAEEREKHPPKKKEKKF